MAQDIEIKCINKTDRSDPHERISDVGGVNADGTPWRLTEDAAIAGIKNGTWRSWTQGGGKSVWVTIAESGGPPISEDRGGWHSPEQSTRPSSVSKSRELGESNPVGSFAHASAWSAAENSALLCFSPGKLARLMSRAFPLFSLAHVMATASG
jgi:Protein of unknown function (DUF3892)